MNVELKSYQTRQNQRHNSSHYPRLLQHMGITPVIKRFRSATVIFLIGLAGIILSIIFRYSCVSGPEGPLCHDSWNPNQGYQGLTIFASFAVILFAGIVSIGILVIKSRHGKR